VISEKLSAEPQILRPFSDAVFQDLLAHVTEIRRIFDWPGVKYHDAHLPDKHKFNRWFWNNLPLIQHLHNSAALVELASVLFGAPVIPSYAFLSMYGPDGTCPVHTDVPQCRFTIDLLISGAEDWPIYIDEIPYLLAPGEAVCYSGSAQPHYRKPMNQTARSKQANLVFFHWVPAGWAGELDPRKEQQ
jgi:hypothetical protein